MYEGLTAAPRIGGPPPRRGWTGTHTALLMVGLCVTAVALLAVTLFMGLRSLGDQQVASSQRVAQVQAAVDALSPDYPLEVVRVEHHYVSAGYDSESWQLRSRRDPGLSPYWAIIGEAGSGAGDRSYVEPTGPSSKAAVAVAHAREHFKVARDGKLGTPPADLELPEQATHDACAADVSPDDVATVDLVSRKPLDYRAIPVTVTLGVYADQPDDREDAARLAAVRDWARAHETKLAAVVLRHPRMDFQHPCTATAHVPGTALGTADLAGELGRARERGSSGGIDYSVDACYGTSTASAAP